MFLVGILTWWYGDGWVNRVRITFGRLLVTIDFFSVPSLLKTLFAPYRQISAGSVSGPIGVKFHAFIDRSISRIIGSVVRLSVVLMGFVVILLQVIFSVLGLIFWIIMPFLPVIGCILWVIEWMPL